MKVDIPEKREKKEKTKPNRYIYIQNHDPEGWIGFWGCRRWTTDGRENQGLVR